VQFSDNSSSTYNIKANATLVRSTTSSPNLIVSDGFVRRIHFRIDLSQLSDSAATHRAFARFHISPDTILGDNRTLIMYVPDSGDFSDPAFLSGPLVVSRPVNAGEEIVDFPMTNTLLGVLSEAVPNNGFVIRFAFENSEIRVAGFYGSSASDTLRPRIFITSSTPADFDR
jgi:hypothetical protein